MESADNECEGMDSADKVEEELELPQAPDLQEFLVNPTKYRPRAEYLYPGFLIEEETILAHCIKHQNVEAVNALIKAGVDTNAISKKGVTPISAAAHKGNVLIMQMLVESGSNVNQANQSGSTALIQASHFGHLGAVDLLLHNDAKADFANYKGTTALMRASQEGHVQISESLLTANVDVNRKNNEGMNALMLASQRGHHNIVMLLIKAHAAMDEQTAQGSTALMLACKRGHEQCAQVLVTMGAEIYMRDKRDRTALDTAIRREHTALLHWLDTQEQIRMIQANRHKYRSALIKHIRKSILANTEQKLELKRMDRGIVDLVAAVHQTIRNPMDAPQSANPVALPFVSRNPDLTVDTIRKSLMNPGNAVHVAHIKSLTPPVALYQRGPGYDDYMWVSLFYKCLSLPHGVFEHIAEYLPTPRVWQWSLLRSRKRCKLAPNKTIVDLSVLMDEILTDACIFSGTNQTNLLVKISRNPQIHPYLVDHMGMPPELLDQLCSFSDLQSLACRMSESAVIFKPQSARAMLDVAIALYRWFKMSCSACGMLGLISSDAGVGAQHGISSLRSLSDPTTPLHPPSMDVVDVTGMEISSLLISPREPSKPCSAPTPLLLIGNYTLRDANDAVSSATGITYGRLPTTMESSNANARAKSNFSRSQSSFFMRRAPEAGAEHSDAEGGDLLLYGGAAEGVLDQETENEMANEDVEEADANDSEDEGGADGNA